MLRKQDLSVLLFYCLGYSKIRNYLMRIRRDAVTTFVTFHDIPFEATEHFKAKMAFLKKRTNVISIDDYLLGKVSCEKINTVITFDDGYKGWLNNAIPVLKELKLPATFFISSGFIGLSRGEGIEFIKTNLKKGKNWYRITGCLSPEDLKGMVDAGYTIGGHTLNHCILTKIKDQKELLYEIAEDKRNLEAFTGHKIHYFSYPSGEHINTEVDLISILKKCGYKGAVTTISGFNKFSTNPYLLHREITGVLMSNMVFQARVYGNYNLVKIINRLLNTIFRRQQVYATCKS